MEYPALYLAKWDAETKTRRLTGVAANDCHHNNVLLVKMVDEQTVKVGTNVDRDDRMRVDLRSAASGNTRADQGPSVPVTSWPASISIPIVARSEM